MVGSTGLLSLIAGVESNNNPNVIAGGGEAALTDMTLDEVRALQRRIQSSGGASTAVGKYQIKDDTLDYLQAEIGLSGSQRFTEELQDQMAQTLLNRRGYDEYKAGQIGEEEFLNRLSKEWAALPKDASGTSYYKGVGNNKALVGYDETVSAIRGEQPAQPTQQVARRGIPIIDRSPREGRGIPLIDPNSFKGPSAVPGQGFSGTPRGNAFTRGGRRGAEQTAGLYGQFLHEVGDATGFASLVEMGDDMVKAAFVEALRNPPDIAELSDVDWTSPSNIATFFAQTLGEQAFNIALAGTGGGLGAFAAKKIVSKRVLKELAKRGAPVRGEFTKAQALKRYTDRFGSGAGKGGIAGGFAAFLPINTGEVIQEQRDAGLDPDLWSSLAIGAPMSALEMVGFGVAAKALFGKASKEAAATTLKQVLGRIGVKSFQSLAVEGGTEAVQEAMVIASRKLKDPTFSVTDAISSSEGLSRIAFAGVSGAVVGGVLGGAGGVARATVDGMQIAKARTTDLRRTIEKELGAEETDKDGNVNSLFGFNVAGQKAVAAVDNVVKAVTKAVVARKNSELNPEEREAANVAAHKAVRDTLKHIQTELKTVGVAVGRLDTIRSEAKTKLNEVLQKLSETSSDAAELTPAQNKAVRKARDQIKEILDELKGKSTEQQIKLLPKALELVDQQVAKVVRDPLGVPVTRVRALVRAVDRALDKTFKQKTKEANALRATLNELQARLNQQVSKRLTPPRPENAGPVTTPEKDIFASIDSVAKTGKEFAFAVGSRLDQVAQKIKDHVAKQGLALRQDGNRVIVARVDNIDKDADSTFTQKLEEIPSDNAVVIQAVNKKGEVASMEVVDKTNVSAVKEVSDKMLDHAGPGGTVKVVQPHEETTRLVNKRDEELKDLES
jgi:muramidase (phage lysozyme)